MFSKSLLCFALLNCVFVHAQLPAEKVSQIDSLFVDWNSPNHPGGAIAIMQGDKTIFSKAYGLASLEYLVPNSTGTRFNVASVSKQFTALAIVLLHLQGKLSIDDTIDAYIDGLPTFGSKITIRHMLHHTSGLRSLHTLFGLAGWRDDDLRTNADLDRIMIKQQDLNFEPGSEYMYCNTGYMFLANIVEKVTGKSFEDYMAEAIFEPLGMHDTYVEAQYNRIVPNNATSYNSTEEGFVRAVEYWGYVGSGNIHTTTADLLKYLKNYYDPLPGWDKAFKTMPTLDLLNDGSPNKYAFGVLVDELFGLKRISHGGSIGGFRSHASVFPEKGTSIVVLTNFSSSTPVTKASKIVKILFKNERAPKNLKIVKTPKGKMQSYVGSYWDDNSYRERQVSINGDTLFYGTDHYKTSFLPVDKEEFVATSAENDSKIEFKDDVMIYYPETGKPMVFEKFVEEPLSPTKAQKYIGSYYSPEIETSYTVHYENGELFAHHIRHGKLPLHQKRHGLLEGEYPLNILKFKRNSEGAIDGVWISNGRVRNLWFEKTE